MNELNNVIYLSNSDYETLVTTGAVTINGTTLYYNENDLYITPDVDYQFTGGTNKITVTFPDGSTQDVNITLSTASANTLGGIKIGNGLSINNGVASVDVSALGLSSAMHFIGIATQASSADLVNGYTGTPTIIDNNSYAAANRQPGDVVLNSVSHLEYIWDGSQWVLLGGDDNYKIVQTAILDPQVSGTSSTFISSISQNTNGNITAAKASLPEASGSVSGIITTGTQTIAGEKTFLTKPLLDTTRLPSEYQEIEYLILNGSQYIDSGIKFNQDTEYSLKFTINSTTAAYGLIGIYPSSGNLHYIVKNSNATNLAWYFNSNSSTYLSYTNCAWALNTIYKIEVKHDINDNNTLKLYFNNNAVLTQTSTATFTDNINGYVGNRNNPSGNARNGLNGKLYEFIIKHNNITYTFIPCYRKSDNVIGFYEITSGSNTFYPLSTYATTDLTVYTLNSTGGKLVLATELLALNDIDLQMVTDGGNSTTNSIITKGDLIVQGSTSSSTSSSQIQFRAVDTGVKTGYFTSNTSNQFIIGLGNVSYYNFNTTNLRPVSGIRTLDLGTTGNDWRNLYLNGAIIKGLASSSSTTYTLTLPDKNGTIALLSDLEDTNYYHTPDYSDQTGTLKIATGVGVNDLYIPEASLSSSGIITTLYQTIGGEKQFEDGLVWKSKNEDQELITNAYIKKTSGNLLTLQDTLAVQIKAGATKGYYFSANGLMPLGNTENSKIDIGSSNNKWGIVYAEYFNGYELNKSVPADAIFTDTTYSSLAAANGGTAVSLVTTGEKYTWNNKSTVPTNHSNENTTYGIGNSSKYGHVKLQTGDMYGTEATAGIAAGLGHTHSQYSTTDIHVNVQERGTTKAYLLADTTAPTNTASAHTTVAETNVYLDTTAGKLVATSFAGDGSALTSINASNISSGTVNANRLPLGNGLSISNNNVVVDVSALGLQNAMHFIGIASIASSENLINGYTGTPVIINNPDYISTSRQLGDIVLNKISHLEYVWDGSQWVLLGGDDNYKIVQTAVSSPSVNGSATAFIDTISQNANGEITVTKKNIDGSSITNLSASNISSGTLNVSYIDGLSTVATSGSYNDLSDIPDDKLFAVNVTLTNATTGTSNKTASEIKIAADGGKIPIVFTSLAGQTMRAFLTYTTNTAAVFMYNNFLHTGSTQDIGRMVINTTGAVAITWGDYAQLASPAFSGTPTTPTAATGTNTTQIASTAFVQQELNTLATVATTGSYSDLINKPTIPIITIRTWEAS